MSDHPTAREVIRDSLTERPEITPHLAWALAGNIEDALTDNGYTITENQ